MKEQLEQTRRINTTTPLTVIGASTTFEVEIPKPILKKQRLSLADTRVSISALTKSSDHQSPIKTTTRYAYWYQSKIFESIDRYKI